MGILTRFFWKKSNAAKETLTEATVLAQSVVDAFSRVVQTIEYPALGFVADTNWLPYDKDTIKNAIKLCIRACNDESQKESLKATYTFLADFQDGVDIANEEKWFAVYCCEKVASEQGKTASALLKQTMVERVALLREVSAL